MVHNDSGAKLSSDIKTFDHYPLESTQKMSLRTVLEFLFVLRENNLSLSRTCCRKS